MPAAWPASLPQCLLRDSYQEGVGEGRRFSRTDTGPGKVFRKTSAMAKPLRAQSNVTSAQLSTFLTFYENDLDGGALAFTLPDPRGGDDLLVRFREGGPAWLPNGDDWLLSLDLEILP